MLVHLMTYSPGVILLTMTYGNYSIDRVALRAQRAESLSHNHQLRLILEYFSVGILVKVACCAALRFKNNGDVWPSPMIEKYRGCRVWRHSALSLL